MNDRETVEEALAVLRRSACRDDHEEPMLTEYGAAACANTVREEILDLRERLSEVEEERDIWRDLAKDNRSMACEAIADTKNARRRADQLEEAAEEAHEAWGEAPPHAGLNSIIREMGRLRSALDSREDEGEPEPGCTCYQEPPRGQWASTDPDCPVHDE